MKVSLFLILIASHFSSYGQIALLNNEALVYSFKTNNGNMLILSRDTTNQYLVCRYGTRDIMEFETQSKTESSWQDFTYSYYMRGGGPENCGLDLNYLAFNLGYIKYVIFDTYSAEGNIHTCGILIIDQISGKQFEIKGMINTISGSLIDFRWNDLVVEGDKLY